MIHTQVNRFINSFVLGLISLFATTSFTVNTFDYGVYHDSAEALLQGKSPYSINTSYYENDPLRGNERILVFHSYFNPPHTIFYVAPFVFWGARVLAFVNVFILLLLFIGTARHPISTALLGVATILSPQLLFVVAAVNIPGLTIGIGLCLLLYFPKKFGRALAWTGLGGRPQDSALLLLVDGWRALHERDWTAFIWGIILMSPTAILLMEWIDSFPDRPPGNTLSPSFHLGYFWTLLYLAVLIGIWWRFKSRQIISQYWLMIVVWQLVQPYVVFYAVWVHLLPIRMMGPIRALILLAGNLAIFIAIGRDFSGEQAQWPMLVALVWITLMLPPREREQAVILTEPLPAS